MSLASGLRRNILTPSIRSSIARPAAAFGPAHQQPQLYRPLFFSKSATRAFSATMGKEGVHNLQAKADFDTAMGEKDSLMVLDCFATWCGPCKVIAPQVVKFSDTYTNVRFYKLDVDEVPEVAQELGIRAMPTFILFKNGEKVKEVVGANPKALETAIQQFL
ncbi:hypothetical protein MBLNU459_g1225t2 [Dothideomycetes sp. NU459]